MRTFGRVILGLVTTLLMFGGFVLIIFGVVLLVWASEPDPLGLNGTFATAGIFCLLLGFGLAGVGVVSLRRQLADVSGAGRGVDAERATPPRP